MENQIIAATIHGLVKNDGIYSIELAQKELEVTETAQRVIDTLYDLYTRRTSKSFGKFAESEDHFPAQKFLRSYTETKEDDFASFTSNMMDKLKDFARQKGGSEGGFVFFAHFLRDGKQYLMVTIIKNRWGAALRGDFSMRALEHLDIEGFRFAGRINISSWARGEERYISFLKGKGNVADYFRDFLGCDTAIQNRIDTSNLVAAIKQFAIDQGLKGVERDEFLAKAKDVCSRCAKSSEELNFDALSNEMMPKEPEVLREYLAHDNLQLNDNFVPDRRALTPLVKIKAAGADWSLEFDREALTSGHITFDPLEETLTINELSDDVVRQLNAERDVKR